METASKHAIWKGAISFGLVHIPIALHSATAEHGIDFDWLDKRSMDPVGYKRVNKKTGREVAKDNIVKGIEYEDGQYVVLSPEEIAAAYPKSTQTIEIECFVDAGDISFLYLERPYYISPINKGEKVYALLREVLLKTGKVGIAKVVIQTKQHLAVLLPMGPTLVLDLLRWSDEVRSWENLNLPAEGIKKTGLTDNEIKMGEQLVLSMSSKWNPADFTDSFKEQILKLVDKKIKAGKTELVTPIEQVESAESGAKIYDLNEILKRSLNNLGKVAKPVTPHKEAATKSRSTKPVKPTPKKAAVKRKSA